MVEVALGPSEAMKERRRFVRFDVRKIVAYEVPDELIRGKSLSENLSPGGIRLRLLTELKPGTRVEMKIGIFGERKPFLVAGCVVWQKEVIEDGKRHLKTGVRFSEKGGERDGRAKKVYTLEGSRKDL